MASCAPPKSAQNEMNELLRAQPLPRACPTPTPLSTAATQTELTMDAIAKLETINLRIDERRLRQNDQKREIYAAKKRKLEQLMIRNANLEQAAREVAASAAALAAATPPLPPLPLPAPLCPRESQLFGSVVV